MGRRSIRTVVLEGIGPVNFRALGEREMKELHREAQTAGFGGPIVSSADERLLALVVSKAAYIEDVTVFAERPDEMAKLATAIVDASWPNRPPSDS